MSVISPVPWADIKHRIELQVRPATPDTFDTWDDPTDRWDLEGDVWDRMTPAAPALWEDVQRDVLDEDGIHFERGNHDDSPDDLVADPGMLRFTLNNSQDNSAKTLCYYTPGDIAARGGFGLGTPVRLSFYFQGLWFQLWEGRITEISPEDGIWSSRKVFVTAKDWMGEASSHQMRGLAALANVRTDQAVPALLESVPIQPPGGTILDEGLDVYPVVFDDVGDGQTELMTALAKLARSGGRDRFYLTRMGELRYENRHARVQDNRNLFVLDGTMEGVVARTSIDDIINRVQVIAHPRTVADSIAVLWTLDEQLYLAPGEERTVHGDYRDPDNPAERVGAIDVQVPLVAGQDYKMSLQPAVVSGEPDTPTILKPDGPGHYTAPGGDFSVISDDSDSTGDEAQWGAAMQKRSWTLGDVVGAANNAAVTGVRITVRLKHDPNPGNIDGSGFGGFMVFYPGLRLNGIDVPLYRTGTQIPHYDAYSSGIHVVEFEAPAPPGGGVWNVAAINAIEFWRYWNWGGDQATLPKLLKVEVRLTFASSVADVDRTGNFTVEAADGGTGADLRIKNNSASDGAYVTYMGIRGRPVRKYNPVKVSVQNDESIYGTSARPGIGERPQTLDMDYQPDPNIGLLHAGYLLGQRVAPRVRAKQATFLANLSPEHMHNALTREISDRIGLIEKMTAQQAHTADGQPNGYHIEGVAGVIEAGNLLRMTWYLSPADPQQYWRPGFDGQQEVGITNVVAPA